MMRIESGSYDDYVEVFDRLTRDYQGRPSVSLVIAFVHAAISTTRQLGYDSIDLLQLVRDAWDKAAD